MLVLGRPLHIRRQQDRPRASPAGRSARQRHAVGVGRARAHQCEAGGEQAM